MRLVSYDAGQGPRAGVQPVAGGRILDAAAALRLAAADDAPAAGGVRGLLDGGPAVLDALADAVRTHAEALTGTGGAHDPAAVRLLAPITAPEKIICLGLNYHDHAAEVGAPVPNSPIVFAKFANSLIGHGATIVPPAVTDKVDYEAELAVVIGRSCRDVDEASALSYVAGAMPLNDVSARDLQLANQLWTTGKAIDTFAPCGPALVTIDEIGDLQNLRIRARVNGVTVQDSTTGKMIFGIAETIAFLSRIMTLVPGDIIATGTPAGVSCAHGPKTFLRTGDQVEIEIDGLGVLSNSVGAPHGTPR
jgi:2-keto-4-pentenoate hydratase/2-oxohepta-3-ene-1,7-dioic acid hydratase in catechol pathway